MCGGCVVSSKYQACPRRVLMKSQGSVGRGSGGYFHSNVERQLRNCRNLSE